jgi:hypothetical protein
MLEKQLVKETFIRTQLVSFTIMETYPTDQCMFLQKTVSLSNRYNITLLASLGDLITILTETGECGYAIGKLSGNLTTTLQRPLSKGGSQPFTLECFYEQFFVQLFTS